MSKEILVVDLDGSLIKTDLLFESFLSCFKNNPLKVLISIYILFTKGIAEFKEFLALNSKIDFKTIPINEEVLEFIKKSKNKGKKLILVTGSHEIFSKKISNAFKLFEMNFGSSKHINLVGKNKKKFLDLKFGKNKYSYIGDSIDDVKVWKNLNNNYVVNPNTFLIIYLKLKKINYEIISENKFSFFKLLYSIRVHQWLKNLLIFLPALSAHNLESSTFFKNILAFISFSLIASSVYIINDFLDLKSDRTHPDKKNRPFANGDVSIKVGFILFGLVLGLSIFTSMILSQSFIILILSYLVINGFYTLYFKRVVIFDLFILAILYCFRIIAGSLTLNNLPSFWLLMFSFFFFFSLATIKRLAELKIKNFDTLNIESGRGYKTQDITILSQISMTTGFISVLVMALYFNSEEVQILYKEPYFLIIICFILTLWISFILMQTHLGKMKYDPLLFAITDKTSLICGLFIFILIILSKYPIIF